MYRTDEDPRCLKSCTLIKDALFELLAEKGNDINNISVSAIAERAQVSRATFYRHFDQPLDVCIWASNRELEISANTTSLFSSNYKLFCKNFFEYWTKNSDLLETLSSIDQPYIFLHSLEKYLRGIAPKLLGRSRLTEQRKGYYVETWSAIVWAILKQWIFTGKKESAEELTDIAIHILPKPR